MNPGDLVYHKEDLRDGSVEPGLLAGFSSHGFAEVYFASSGRAERHSLSDLVLPEERDIWLAMGRD